MAKKSTKHTIGERDTFNFNTQTRRINAFLRDDNGQVAQYELPVQFDEDVEGFVTRKHIIASGEIDLANWELVEVREEYVAPSDNGGQFDPNNIVF